MNIDILGISELKWAGISDFNSAAATAKSLQSCPTLCNPRDGTTRLPRPWDSPGKNTGVGVIFNSYDHYIYYCGQDTHPGM